MATYRVGWEAQSCREGGWLQTPRKSLGDQWPHWCSALKKAAHWHDVIFYMPSVIPPPPAIKPDKHTDTVLTTWDHEEEADVNVGSGLCTHFLFSLQTDFLIRTFGLLDTLVQWCAKINPGAICSNTIFSADVALRNNFTQCGWRYGHVISDMKLQS